MFFILNAHLCSKTTLWLLISQSFYCRIVFEPIESDEDVEKRKLEYEKSVEEHFMDLTKLCETLKKGCICKAPEDFQWDRDNDNWNLG